MNAIKVNIKDWFWVMYPVLVVVGIFVGLMTVFGDGGQRIANLTGAQDELALQKAELARLQQKESLLESVDTERETAVLTRLVTALPATKKVWLLVSELAEAGVQAGAPLTDMSGIIGDVKDASEAAVPASAEALVNGSLRIEATYEIENFSQVRMIVEQLARALPLIRINSLAFDEGNLEVVAEGAWSSWTSVSAEANNPLPDITTEVAEVLARLADFVVLPGVTTDVDFLSTANPF